MATESKATEQVYGIRAVSRLTGVQAVTLRAWERRYGAVSTRRSGSGGRRLYSQEDVQRLSLIKSLVDLGEAVSHVAALPTAELNARLDASLSVRASHAEHALIQVAVFGPRVAAMLRADVPWRGIELVAVHTDSSVCQSQPAAPSADVVVLEFAGVHEDTRAQVLDFMRAAGASRAVVMYDFGNLASIASLKALPVAAVRGPAEPEEIIRACLALAAPRIERSVPASLHAPPGEIPRRRFSSARLNRLREASIRIGCECPHHLATLIGQLYAFEDYCAQCEQRNVEDAQLHAYLHSSTARGRAELEDALERLITIEGLEDPPGA